ETRKDSSIFGKLLESIDRRQFAAIVARHDGDAFVFDKGYCDYGWWRAIAAAGSVFVTRPKRGSCAPR
ncbi:MAG: hypothetical protein C3F11_13405, partial [Methylocystaceae bacterium]